MTKKTAVSIGNGLYVRSGRRMTSFEREMEAIRRRQRICEYKRRDLNGACYHCGLRVPYEPAPGERN